MNDDASFCRAWKDLTLEEFLDLVSARAPSPGGGAVAAMALAMAASLVQMVIAYSDTTSFGDRVTPRRLRRLSTAGAEALALAQQDAEAYAVYRAAVRSGSATARRRALDAIVDTPLAVCELAAEIAGAAAELGRSGNPRLHADAFIAARLASAAAAGTAALVKSNLPEEDGDRHDRLGLALASCRDAAATLNARRGPDAPAGAP